MREQNTSDVIWLHTCENTNMPHEITDLKIGSQCEYFDDDSWVK